MNAKTRRFAPAVVALGASLAVSLLAAELAVRYLAPQPVWIQPPGLYRPDPPARYRLAAGVDGRMTDRTEYAVRVRTSPQGLRVPGTPQRAATAGAPRVLALGDSFTFGVGVEEEETWVERLREQLAERGVAIEAVNGGVPGYGAVDEVALYERHLAALHPDLVVIAAYLANDLLDSSPESLTVQVRAHDGAILLGGAKPGILDWLNRHSHLYLLAKNAAPALAAPLLEALGRWPNATLRQIRIEMGAYAQPPTEGARLGMAATDRAYGRLVELTRAAGVPLVGMIVPEHITVDPVFWRERFRYIGRDPAGHDPQAPRRIVAGLFRKHGVPFVDLTGAVAAAEAGGTCVYFPVDTHFTPAGHALAARELGRFLLASGLLGGPAEPTPSTQLAHAR